LEAGEIVSPKLEGSDVQPVPQMARRRSCAAPEGGPLMAAKRPRFAQPEFFAFWPQPDIYSDDV